MSDPLRTPKSLSALAETIAHQAEGLKAAAGALLDQRWTHPDRFLAVAVLANELAKNTLAASSVATYLEGIAAAHKEA